MEVHLQTGNVSLAVKNIVLSENAFDSSQSGFLQICVFEMSHILPVDRWGQLFVNSLTLLTYFQGWGKYLFFIGLFTFTKLFSIPPSTINEILIFVWIRTPPRVGGGREGGRGGVRGTLQSSIRGGFAPGSYPLPFCIVFWQKRFPLLYKFHWNKSPFTYFHNCLVLRINCQKRMSSCHFYVVPNKWNDIVIRCVCSKCSS